MKDSKFFRIAIVEDDIEFLEELLKHLGSIQNVRIVGTFETAEEALIGLKDCLADIVFVDLRLPQGSGIEVIEKLKPQCPDTSFIVLSVCSSDIDVFSAIEAGAIAYLAKDETNLGGIKKVLEDIVYGGSVMSPNIARMVLTEFKRIKFHRRKCRDLEQLTPREREVLKFLGKGYSDKEISECMKISVYTVREYLKKIYKKLEINSRAKIISKYKECFE